MDATESLSIAELFEEQVRRTPAEIAVEFKDDCLTYGELNQRANQLARFLLSKGVEAETCIGLCLDRSLEMVIALMAILKAGAAYLPLDPAYPEGRLAFMLEDSECPLLITDSKYTGKFVSFGGEILCLGVEWAAIARQEAGNLGLEISARQLACVMYTSGSTGEPKGVMVEQAGWHNYISSAQKAYGLKPGERVLQFASLNWDTSAEEIFPTITSGATLVLRPPEMMDSFSRFWQFCGFLGISVLSLPTAFWNELVAYLASQPVSISARLRVVIIGGERALGGMVNQWHGLVPCGIQLFNTYGQTECTAVTTRCLLPPGRGYDTVPIGSAVENVSLLVMDSTGSPAQPGEPGELCVGGAGLGRGYLNREALTAEKFVALPSGRYYRTGDLVRENGDGSFEYLGRIDSQLKIRGIRIEPGEVEAALLKHPAVRLAAVAGQPLDQPRKLVAYLVLDDPAKKVPPNLRDWLKGRLSEAFIPSLFIPLESIPLTVNGKVDWRALPASPAVADDVPPADEAPVTEMESRLLALWRDYLKNPRLGIHDDFFEHGGDSLIIVQIVTELEHDLGKTFPFSLIFHASTVSKLAALIEERSIQPVKSAVVPVKPSGGRTPLFCVHADGGAFFYLNFAKFLGADQPFYGLQARGLDPDEEPFTSLDEMAAYYVGEIRKIQPQGPYLLGGFSVGGTFAYEMAQQLIAQGQDVGLLAMLDANAPDYPACRPRKYSNLSKLTHWLSKRPEGWPENGLRRLRVRLQEWSNDKAIRLYRQMGRPLTPDLRVHLVRRLNQGMGDRYRPKPYPYTVSVFCAEEQDEDTLHDDALGWANHVTGPIQVYRIPGNHETIFKEPLVRSLAEAVQQALDAYRDRLQPDLRPEALLE